MNPIKNDSHDYGFTQPKNTLPFNLADALAGKPVIREHRRTKAVQVIHADRLPRARNVLVVFEDGAYDFYSATGQSLGGRVRLWMEHTGEPVPFSVDGWKKGWKPVFRNGMLTREVCVFETATADSMPVVSVDEHGYMRTHRLDGGFRLNDSDPSSEDLLLIPPTQE